MSLFETDNEVAAEVPALAMPTAETGSAAAADETPAPIPTAEPAPEIAAPEIATFEATEPVTPIEPEPPVNQTKPQKETFGFKRVVAVVVLGAVLCGLSAGIGFGIVYMAARDRDAAAQLVAQVPEPAPVREVFAASNQPSAAPSLDENLPGSFSEIIGLVEPSVVNISSVLSSSQDYFGLPETPRGSGIIFKEDDEKVYIVTNYHVVSGADSVSVSITGHDPVNAGLIGKEQQSDIAVIYVMKTDLDAVGVHFTNIARFGNSDQMLVGDVVLAIGNAMGEGNTTTQGIISAQNKDIKVDQINLTVIQTDAAINPGNSGGPLVNMRGEVIGMNTAKTQPYLGTPAEGMGYSIASNIVMPIVDEIMLMKPKAYLGIRGNTVTKAFAEQYGVPELGVLVTEVIEGAAAEAAGMQSTDIITAFKGEPIFTMEALQAAVKKCTVGDEVEVKLLRGGKTPMTLTAKLTASDDGNF